MLSQMSVSSGSDVTIPIQDSPPPPPSPYANGRGGGPSTTTPTGIENIAYSPSDSEKMKKSPHTEVPLGDPSYCPPAVNSELINMSIMSTIPAKPQSEFGPYEQMDDYFVPVNQHKKFLSRRSEKLYVTKDKRSDRGWKKCLCWTFAAFVLAAVVAVGILAAVGVIPQTSEMQEEISAQVGGMTTEASILAMSSTTMAPYSSEQPTSPRPTRPSDDSHVAQAATATFYITSLTFEAALANKSSSRFHELASQVETEMRKTLLEDAGLGNVTLRVDEFQPGSVIVKMFLSWSDESMDLEQLQKKLMGKTELGGFTVGPVALNKVVNYCKFNGNNGCSHVCKYDYVSLEFICSCPPPLHLNSADKKTCESPEELASSPEPESEPSSVPEVVVSSSPEPSVEPEAEPETSPVEPEPTPEEDNVSSSVAPELSHLPVGDPVTSSTTPEPRAADIEFTTEGPEPEPEVPVEPEIQQSSTTTTTTTTEAPAVVPVEQEDEVGTTLPTPVEVPVVPQVSTESTPVEEFPAIPPGESETQRPLSAVPHESSEETGRNIEDDSVIVAVPSSTTSTTTTAPVSSSTTTTTEPPAVAVVEETHSEPLETSNLHQESLEVVPIGTDEEVTTGLPPAAAEESEVEVVQLTKQSNNSASSSSAERAGRQDGALFGSNSVEDELSEAVTTEPSHAAPNSGEIMVYSDHRAVEHSHRASTEKNHSNEGSAESSSDTQETIDVISANNPIELPLPAPSTSTPPPPTSTLPPSTSSTSAVPNVFLPVEREETTTIRPISLEKDIDVNNEAGATEDTLHQSENVDLLPSLTAESSELSVETDEVDTPNRDHRRDASHETTLSPVVVVFDEEVEGVTTNAPPPPSPTSRGVEESENELEGGSQV